MSTPLNILKRLHTQLYATGTDKRLLGMDVGSRYVGIAVTEAGNMSAKPLVCIHRKVPSNIPHPTLNFTPLLPVKITSLGDKMRDLIKKNNAIGIVVGLPLMPDGTEGERCEETKKFIYQLIHFGGLNTDIYYSDERYSTQYAEAGLLESMNAKTNKHIMSKQSNKRKGHQTETRKKFKTKNDLKKEDIDQRAAVEILELFLADVEGSQCE